MCKIALIMVEEMQGPWEGSQNFQPYSMYKIHFFCETFIYTEKEKNQSCLRTEFFKAPTECQVKVVKEEKGRNLIGEGIG